MPSAPPIATGSWQAVRSFLLGLARQEKKSAVAWPDVSLLHTQFSKHQAVSDTQFIELLAAS